MIQAKTLDKYFFYGLLPFHPLLFMASPFFVVFFKYIFYMYFESYFFSFFFFFFFFRFVFLTYSQEHFNNNIFKVQQNMHYWSSGSALSVLLFECWF